MSIKQIPPEKFEEWTADYVEASALDRCYNNACKKCPISKPLVDDKTNVYTCLSLSEYLSIKSKEYMEANQ